MASQQRETMVGHVAVTKGFGLDVPESSVKFDWTTLKRNRDANVANLVSKYGTNWRKEGITYLEGVAAFDDAKTVRVKLNDGGEKVVHGKHVVIAVGGLPAKPSIPGAEYGITSDDFFDLEQQPKKVAVLGAGYIAVEMAGIFHGLGSEAHLFFRGKTVLRHGFDPYIVETLMGEMEAHGPTLHHSCQPKKLSKAKDGRVNVSFCDPSNAEKEVEFTGFDCVLFAIGRKPVTSGLRLERAGVTMSDGGLIAVDAHENTNVPGIYALGDCTTHGFELTPVAIAAGRRLADRLFGGEPRARIAYETIATVVFSHPPIGTIGLTEPDAKREFGEANITVKQARFASMLYGLNPADAKVKTALKLVLCGPEERVVGLHCIGPFSDEMMQGFAVAVRMGATRRDFEASVAIHPTIAEEFVTFGGWGQAAAAGADGKKKPLLPPYIEPSADAGACAAPPQPPPGTSRQFLLLGTAFIAGVAFAGLSAKR